MEVENTLYTTTLLPVDDVFVNYTFFQRHAAWESEEKPF